MQITKVSPRTGQENTMDINVTEEQIAAWKAGGMIQSVMPKLTPDEREFLMTGYTQADWDAIFPAEEE